MLTYIFRTPLASGGHTSTAQMLNDIQGWLVQEPPRLSATAETLLDELVVVLEDLAACRTFKELTHSGLIARGRGIKQRFKEEFAHPAVLAAVVNYNLVSGRRFEQLLSEALAGAGDFPLDLAAKEYRSAAEGFQQLSETAKAASLPSAAGESTKPAAGFPKAPGGLSQLGIDVVAQEGRLYSLTNELVSFARSAGKSVSTFPMPNSSVTLAPWEAQSLAVEHSATEKSFRADFNSAVRRAVGLLAAIQEESALYKLRRHGDHLWKKCIDALVYLLYSGRETLPTLEELAQDAGRRGLQEKADQLWQTAARLRDKLHPVAELCRQWKEQSGPKERAYAA